VVGETVMAQDQKRRGSASTLRQLAALAGAGVQFAVTVALCTAGGWWLDDYLGWSPWLLITGGLVGAVAAFYQLYRTLLDVDGVSKPGEDH
jgi:F0F1-type ATP synthase assembly protein I